MSSRDDYHDAPMTCLGWFAPGSAFGAQAVQSHEAVFLRFSVSMSMGDKTERASFLLSFGKWIAFCSLS